MFADWSLRPALAYHRGHLTCFVRFLTCELIGSINPVEDMGAPFPTLLVSRRARQVGVDWTGARSWLGGAPRIGAMPWPRDNKAEPLLFVAQIDLAEVAAKTGKTPLPDKGSQGSETIPRGEPRQPRPYPDPVDDTLDGSFPASDPPSWAGW